MKLGINFQINFIKLKIKFSKVNLIIKSFFKYDKLILKLYMKIIKNI
jgi:hypothetical protein